MEEEEEASNFIEKFKNWDHTNSMRIDLNGRREIVKCTQVYDGDTCWISLFLNDTDRRPIEVQVRMYGYDSPELKTSNKDEKIEGVKCKKVLEDLILGKLVYAIFGDPVHPKKKDKYGRSLATLFVGKKIETENGMIETENGMIETENVIDEHNRIAKELICVSDYMLENTRCYEYYGAKKKKFGQDY